MSLAALVVGVVLTWSAPESCPAEQVLRSDIETLLGRSLDAPFARWVDVHATVRRAPGTFVLQLTGDGSGGPFSRTLEDPSCSTLVNAAALIVALAIDPSLMEPPVEPEPPPPPVEEPPLEVVDPIESPPSSGLPLGLPWPRLGLSVLGAVEGGVHPRAGGGVQIAGALLWRYLRLEGLVSYWFERAVRIEAQPDSGADVSLIAAGGRACPTMPWVIEASICAGIDLGQLRVDPVALPGEAGRDFWGALVLGAALAWEPIEMLAFRLTGEGFWSVFRPSYVAGDLGEIHRPSRFGGRAALGIEVRFF